MSRKILILSVLIIQVGSFNHQCFAQIYIPEMPRYYDIYPVYRGKSYTEFFVQKDKKLIDSHAHNFKVVLKNDSVLQVGGKIDYSVNTYFLRVWIPRDMGITPGLTKCIIRTPEPGFEMVGVSYDTCWLFKVESGRINSYSGFAEFEKITRIAIQLGDGPIVPLNASNLLEMVGDDPKLIKLIKGRNYDDAIIAFNKKVH